jgi:hypothetical protein
LHEKTDLVRRVEALLGEKHAATCSAMGEHTPESAVEKAAGAHEDSLYLSRERASFVREVRPHRAL